MTILRLRDNRFGDKGFQFKKHAEATQETATDTNFVSVASGDGNIGNQQLNPAQKELMSRFGTMTLGDLSSLSNGALVDLSGSHLEEYNQDRGKKNLRFIEYHENNAGFRLDTSNLMGALRFRDPKSGEAVQVEILSRFDSGSNNYFLNYLLSKALNVAVGSETVVAQNSSVLDLLLDVVFVKRFGDAARNGLLRQYRTYRNNDWNFKGRLDVSRHIRENIPLPHGIAYVKREIDLDVPVNRMLLLASQVVQRRRPDLFDNNEDATDAFRILRTGIADPGDIRTVLSCRDCRESISHPFYRETWEPLRQIARMILEEEKWQIFQEDAEEEVSGVVFDGAWLWEEYLATVLVECGYRHCVRNQQPENDKFESLKNEYNSNNVAPMYPDFVRKDGDRYVALADAKYKRFLTRDDRLQMIAYSFIYDAKVVSIIYPPEDVNCEGVNNSIDEEFTIGDSNNDEQGYLGWFNIRSVSSQAADKTTNKYLRILSLGKITTRDSFEDLAGVMYERECRLRRMLQETAPEL